MSIKITGVGSYIPKRIEKNSDFQNNQFFNVDGTLFPQPNSVIIEKFRAITGIGERRYLEPELRNSDMALFASEKAIKDANVDPEQLDYIIVAHNYGDIESGKNQSDTVPSIASRVKNKLQIKNPNCVAFDMLFGCPGWIQAVLQANAFIKSGMAKKCLVIGSETLSRVIDPHDRDSMIYSDGAGATVLEASDEEGGILSYENATFSLDESNYIYFGQTNHPEKKTGQCYIKMHGRKIYEFALKHVPSAMKTCLEKSGASITDVKKILIHQANEKMDEAIIRRFYKMHNSDMP
ncbi:MAG TPA: ketoacyl-ACP synthase III, partial [Salinimicrobium sp.]|nr:ketoacyl-ACP synthase III [Salinimicrobium sp.]